MHLGKDGTEAVADEGFAAVESLAEFAVVPGGGVVSEAYRDRILDYEADLQGSQMAGSSRNGTDFGGADLRDSNMESNRSAANFTEANLQGAIEFIPLKTDIFCRTIVPGGSVRNDGCWPERIGSI